MIRSSDAVVGSASLTFFSFALPISMLGVLWPDVRTLFNQSLGTLGLVALVYSIGRMSMATSGRRLIRHAGLGRSFIGSLVLLVASGGILAGSTSWPMFLAGFFCIGVVSGMLDSLGAAFITSGADISHAALIHGSYGLGATVGPLLVAIMPSWRWSVVAGACIGVAGLVVAVVVRQSWPVTEASRSRVDSDEPLPILAASVSLTLFAAFVAVEVTTGQWAFTYLTESRGLGEGLAAIGVAGFWGGTTLGRLAMARRSIGVRVDRLGLIIPAAASAVFVAGMTVMPGPALVALLFLTGCSLAPIVPTLFATTAMRVGPTHAQRLAGWQLLATNLGAIAVPSATGVLVDLVGPWVIVVVVAATLAAVGFPLLIVAARIAPVPADETPSGRSSPV